MGLEISGIKSTFYISLFHFILKPFGVIKSGLLERNIEEKIAFSMHQTRPR